MLKFENQPPADPRGNSLPLLRCPTNRAICGIITSSDLVGTNTHYYRGRTIPCDHGDCPACADGVPWRWHGYVGLFSTGTNRQVLFEFTAKCSEPLVQYRKAYHTLRGCMMTAKRANSSPNSRVILMTKPADLEKITLPKEPNLLEALSIIWNIERPAIAVDGLQKESPRLHVEADPEIQSNRIRSTLSGYDIPATKGNGKIA